MLKRLQAALPLLLLFFAQAASATSLDITSEYRVRALSYKNLSLNTDEPNNHSFISQSARLGFALKDIQLLDNRQGDASTMNIVLKLRALGVSGSTEPFSPIDRIAAAYPSADFTPFLENAYLDIRRLGGHDWDLAIGRQSYRLGSGLLLGDNGAGLLGVSARMGLPWLGIEGGLFAFQSKDLKMGGQYPSHLDLYGLTVELPTEGTWQLNQLIERDHTTQSAAVNGCGAGYASGCLISQATRWFSSLRYRLRYGPMIFDGEAALERGAGTPTGAAPAPRSIRFSGNAQVFRAKWKQTFFTNKSTGKKFRGIARLSLARGSGDDPGTPYTNEAFFPSRGERFDGLERSGFGDFFGATPYDAFGGQSTATFNGLQRGASGIIAVGMGMTPPAYRGVILDVDYYLFQAARNVGPDRSLGSELDIQLRYDIRDRLQIHASMAMFKTGAALNANVNSARRYMLEASGRF